MLLGVVLTMGVSISRVGFVSWLWVWQKNLDVVEDVVLSQKSMGKSGLGEA